MKVKISPGNSKMGSIPSVSLPAGTTCAPGCPCWTKCYARKLERIRPTVHRAYVSNYDLLMSDPSTYWKDVEEQISLSRFFRFHVAGDIPNAAYLSRMVGVAQRNERCDILCFTKRYEIVNDYLRSGLRIPKNLHIIFSAWRGWEMDNPYNLPEAHVKYRDGTTTAREDAILCAGNCTECATTAAGGCWTLKNGEQVVFHEH